jgi:hypothetical protein
LRVIIVREDVQPSDIGHPLLFKPNAAHSPLSPVTQSLFRPSAREQGADPANLDRASRPAYR